MQIIQEKTESKLLQTLKGCWETLPAHRCLQLKFSQTELNIEEWLELLTYEINEYTDDQSAQIYVCDDQDIFVLTRTLTQKRVDEFLAHLLPKLTPTPSSPGLASLFEIGVDWPRLRQICEKKIEHIELLKAAKNKSIKLELQKVHKTEALKTLNQDLIKSLSQRRQKREEPHIMVVEDDLFSQKMVKNALKNKYTVSMSADGAGAIMSYVRNAPDILFLDIGLPDINGHEVLERVFNIDPDAYVVMFSGNGDKENVLKAIGIGAKGFVGKPFTQEKIIEYIEKSPFVQNKQKKGMSS